jgi:YVTN family beta-propeller protein
MKTLLQRSPKFWLSFALLSASVLPIVAQTSRLVTGKKISPTGINQEIGSMPMNIITSPNGKFAITTDMGFHQSLWSISTSTGTKISEVQFENSVTNPSTYGLYYGLAFGADGTLYAAQGENQTIAKLSLSSGGALALTGSIATKPGDFPSGLAADSRGFLYVANNDPDTFIKPTSVAIYNAAGLEVGRYTFTASFGGTPNFPLAIAVSKDGSKTYVASQRDSAVYVLDTANPASPSLVTKIDTGSHPSGLLFNKSQGLLYVSNAHSDTISVVSTGSDSVVGTVLLRSGKMQDIPGATPLGLALSPDQKTLFVAMGDMNAVAVADVTGNDLKVRGYIPVGWYPTGVVTSTDGKKLLVTNAKGVKAKNPSTGYVQWEFNDNPWYDLNKIRGTVSFLGVPDHSELAQMTEKVMANNRLNSGDGNESNDSYNQKLNSIGLKAGKIKHVIYIVKENRTYDQVLGDLPQGNGDPSLVLFGSDVTPNLHALAQRFVLLDNFYDVGEASGDGWPWSTQSMANEYVIKNLPYNYSNRGRNYDFEGQDNGYLVGGHPAKDPNGNTMSVLFPGGAPPIPDVAEAPGGHIWDAARAAKLSYRNYGFFYSFGVSQNNLRLVPDNYPAAAGLQPAGRNLTGVSDFDFRRYDNDFPDSNAPKSFGCLYSLASYGAYNMPSRYAEWKREFDMMLTNDPSGNSVPSFMTVRFNHDHTQGLTPGKFTPRAEVADNDYAVGQLVEAISNSPIWESTAVFIVEDDAQDGPDHVDAHRSTAFVISPWIHKNAVDHRFYNTDSILKTMESILGLPPLTQYDAIANPIDDFDTAPSNNAPYAATPAGSQVMCEKTPSLARFRPGDPMRKWALESAKMNFNVPDSAPAGKLNLILWKSVKGPKAVMPKSRHAVTTDSRED